MPGGATGAKERLVVVGNGMAGARLVEDLLALDRERFAIAVIGGEAGGSYNRILLSQVLAGDRAAADIVTHHPDWYARAGVALRSGESVTAIDRAERAVVTAAGARLSYDRLVLATGSAPIRLDIPGVDLPGVVTFRDAGDVERMIAAAAPRTSAVVIGGGLLGLEAAEGLRRRGVSVTVVHLMPWLMERQLDRRAAAMLARAIGARGIAFEMAAKTEAILGRDRVTGIRLGDGRELAADLVVMAVGIRPNAGLARAAGLDCRSGVMVDDRMATSDGRIHALGECVEHAGRSYGLVGPIWEQAQILAQVLAGDEAARYRGSVPATSLKVAGVDLYSIGTLEGEEEIVLEDAGRGVYRKLVLEAGRLAGAVLYGDTGDAGWYVELMRQRHAIARLRNDLVFGRAFAERGAGGEEAPPRGGTIVAEAAAA